MILSKDGPSQRSASSSQSPARSVSSSCQRVLDFKRTAVLLPRSGTGLAEAETGQAEPDWPASADWLPNVPKVPFFAGTCQVLEEAE